MLEMSSSVAFLRATRRPSNITPIRSLNPTISSKSSDRIMIAAPLFLDSTIFEWTSAVLTASRPLVGLYATSTLVSLDSSRATNTFWRFPPERYFASRALSGGDIPYSWINESALSSSFLRFSRKLSSSSYVVRARFSATVKSLTIPTMAPSSGM